MSYSMQDIRRAIVHAALDYRDQVIKDYEGGQQATPGKIERLVDMAGAGWDLGEDREYTHEHELEWCGYLVGACARRVGDFLHSDKCVDVTIHRKLASKGMGSTYRIQASEYWDPYRPPKTIPAHKARRGDILVVETTGSQQWGDHIALVRGRPTEGDIPTIEGNAQDVLLGDQTRGEGVGTRARTIDDVYACYRLRPEHFTGSDWQYKE